MIMRQILSIYLQHASFLKSSVQCIQCVCMFVCQFVFSKYNKNVTSENIQRQTALTNVRSHTNVFLGSSVCFVVVVLSWQHLQ